MKEQLYDVFIYESATGKIESVIGQNMKSWDGAGSLRNSAELRVQTGQERINDSFCCDMFEAGKFQKGDCVPV